MRGSVPEVEESENGLSLLDTYSVLMGKDIYSAVWTTGESTIYGKEVALYDAQFYLLLTGCGDKIYYNRVRNLALKKEGLPTTLNYISTSNSTYFKSPNY